MKNHQAPKLKILIADDSLAISRRLVDLLSDIDGVEILGPAHNGRDALTLFHQYSPDVVLLDMQMPELNGYEVLRAIRKTESDCVVIIHTLHRDEALRRRCLDAGAEFFLTKTETSDQLVDIVQGLLVRDDAG